MARLDSCLSTQVPVETLVAYVQSFFRCTRSTQSAVVLFKFYVRIKQNGDLDA